ncbi:15197_t:CDS:2, partial [Entrophospora sp. SA101]
MVYNLHINYPRKRLGFIVINIKEDLKHSSEEYQESIEKLQAQNGLVTGK